MNPLLSPTAMQTPQQLVPTAAVPPQLDLGDIQGDVVIGLQKKCQRFVFFTISPNVAGFKAVLRGPIARAVTSADRVREREGALRDHKIALATGLVPASEQVLSMDGLNVAFTHSGLAKLLPAGTPFAGTSLQALTKTASQIGSACGDRMGLTAPAEWEQAFLDAEAAIDGVFLITGGSRVDVDGAWTRLSGEIGSLATEVWHDGAVGNVRPGAQDGHEHFGWQDGISQPAVKGISDPLPGQDTIPAGMFVFGQEGGPAPSSQWMENGSLMVFRKLEQSVPAFDQFLKENGDRLGMDAALLGARMMGRWKSGAPLVLAPMQDNPELGADPGRNNDFDYSEDVRQRRCPFGSHIRKTNPRTDLPGVGAHRIMRAGIPYGLELTEDKAASRGLLFVCYQTSIDNQFEVVQGLWSNNPGFVPGSNRPAAPGAAPTGPSPAPPAPQRVIQAHDPIIGQAAGSPRFMDEPLPNYPTGMQGTRLELAQQFVTPRAGIYLFVPSISALMSTLSAPT